MTNLLDLQLREHFFGLFIGRSGSGKSAAASCFDKPYLEIDCDLRAGGILDWARKGYIDGSQVEIKQFPPDAGWIPVDNFLSGLKAKIPAGTFPYKTIGLGSLTNLTRLLVITSHGLQTGKTLGGLRVSGPGDYMFESTGTHQIFDYLRTFPCNVIITAHTIDKWGKKRSSSDYSPAEVIGEKLSIRDNLGENVQTYFDNVFKFTKEIQGNITKYFVEFTTDIAKNSHGLPPGKFDITDKNFKDEFERLKLMSIEGKLEAPIETGFQLI
jgi:hypothetical protein